VEKSTHKEGVIISCRMGAFGIAVSRDAVCIFPPDISKSEALDSLVDAVAASRPVTDVEAFRRALFEREAIMSTGIGGGIAIPHVRIDEVPRPVIGVGISKSGIDYDTLDSKPVHVVVLFAMPSGSHKEYLGLLAQVMHSLKNAAFRTRLMACSTGDEVAVVVNEPVP